MKIALIQCDEVQEDLQLQHGNYQMMILTFLRQGRQDFSMDCFDAKEGLPEQIKEYDAFIISGSRASVNDNLPWMISLEKDLLELLQKQKKMIGICFGHQLLAKALGGRVALSHHGWRIGIAENTLLENIDWIPENAKSFSLVNSHREQVIDLPEATKLLASSHQCPYAMLQYGKYAIGIQGHPEFSAAFAADLIEQRRELFEVWRYQQGIASLTRASDSAIFAHWLWQFFSDEGGAG